MKRFQSLLLVLGALALPGCFLHHDDDDDDEFTVVKSSAEIEPNDESASPHFLGVLRHGEEMRVSGAADATLDEFDGFAIALTKESEIEFELEFDDLAGELDVWVYDPAVDDIALFFEDDFSPDRGTFEVHTPVLDFHIIVRAFSGASPYNLKVRARPIPFLHFHSEANLDDADVPFQSSPKSGVRSSVVPSDAERLLGPEERRSAIDAYLGRSQEPNVAEDPAVRSGTAFAIGPKGEVATAPVFTLPSGARLIRIDVP
jgi:hypothetical protein